MRLFKKTTEYSEPFPTVALAWFSRYPNPYAKHIISCDVLSRSLTPEGTLHTRRLILKSGSLPVWAQAIVGGWGGLVTYVVEDSWCNPYPPFTQLRSTTKNITHAKFLFISETAAIMPAPVSTQHPFASSITTHDIEGRIKTNIKASPEAVKRKIEEFGETRFAKGLEKSRLGLLTVMAKIRSRELVPNTPLGAVSLLPGPM